MILNARSLTFCRLTLHKLFKNLIGAWELNMPGGLHHNSICLNWFDSFICDWLVCMLTELPPDSCLLTPLMDESSLCWEDSCTVVVSIKGNTKCRQMSENVRTFLTGKEGGRTSLVISSLKMELSSKKLSSSSCTWTLGSSQMPKTRKTGCFKSRLSEPSQYIL